MSTLEEIKHAAATLPVQARSELMTWLGEARDVSELRREELRQEIQIGIDEIRDGKVAVLDMDEIKRKARAGVGAR